MSYNEINPAMLEQAHILGGQRGPTETERLLMQRAMLTMAMTTVAGACTQSLLESGGYRPEEAAEVSLRCANFLLERTEQSKDDFDGNVEKQKIRNQLAANLLYSALRGGDNREPSKVVNSTFDAATTILNRAVEYAENDSADSSIIVA